MLVAVAATSAADRVAAAPRDADLFVRPEDQHTVLFGSLEAGRSVFVSGGSKQALTGSLDREGFVALESSGFGLTRERVRTDTGAVAVDRFKVESSALLGYQLTGGPAYVAAYLGPEIQEEQLTYDGRVRRFSKPRFGLRGQAEIYANPTPDTLLTGTVVMASARESVWLRGAAGVRVWADAFVGPEVIVYATPTYRELRTGLHLTGPLVGPLSFRISGGWLTDDVHRSGSPYVGLSAWIRL